MIVPTCTLFVPLRPFTRAVTRTTPRLVSAHPRNDHQTRVRPTPPRGPPPAHRLYNPPASKPTRFAENSEAPEISPSLASPSCAARRRKRGEEKAAAKQASHGRRRRVLRRLEEVDPPRGVPALPRHRRRRLHLRRPARPQHHRQPRSQVRISATACSCPLCLLACLIFYFYLFLFFALLVGGEIYCA